MAALAHAALGIARQEAVELETAIEIWRTVERSKGVDDAEALVWAAKARLLRAAGKTTEADAADRESRLCGEPDRLDAKERHIWRPDIDAVKAMGERAIAQEYEHYTALLARDPFQPDFHSRAAVLLVTGAVAADHSVMWHLGRSLRFDPTRIDSLATDPNEVRGLSGLSSGEGAGPQADADTLWEAIAKTSMSVVSAGSRATIKDRNETRLLLERAIAQDPGSLPAVGARALIEVLDGHVARARSDSDRSLPFYLDSRMIQLTRVLIDLADAHDAEARTRFEQVAWNASVRELLEQQYPELLRLKR
jgi:hypothetical protein